MTRAERWSRTRFSKHQSLLTRRCVLSLFPVSTPLPGGFLSLRELGESGIRGGPCGRLVLASARGPWLFSLFLSWQCPSHMAHVELCTAQVWVFDFPLHTSAHPGLRCMASFCVASLNQQWGFACASVRNGEECSVAPSLIWTPLSHRRPPPRDWGSGVHTSPALCQFLL